VHINSSELVKKKFEKINSNFTNLTENIGQESVKQQKEIKNFIRNSAEIIFMNIEENNKKVELITEYFKKLGEEIPTALKVSLENLNNGLATLTRKFKDDYEDVLNQYKKNIKR
jgi:GTP-dependent phosphoenolpyruvate carboxykinase